MSLPVVIIGSGGHAKVVADTLAAMGRVVRGFLDIDPARWNSTVNGIPVLGGDDALNRGDTSEIELANGIGSVRSLELRRAAFERYRAIGFRFVTIVHPRAVVSPSVRLEEGAQIMAGAIIQPDVVIGENTIVNTGAIVDHDCRIGAHCHIAPGCTLSGNVTVGVASHIGTGASVKQGVKLGTGAVVGAGAAVVFDHQGGATLMGVPASAKA
jgi:sugar O-acyltransferase (sialic acid O-acetyltransferase NeuD family)